MKHSNITFLGVALLVLNTCQGADQSPVPVSSPQTGHAAGAPAGSGTTGDAQLFVQAKKAGDYVDVAIPAKEPGPRRIVLLDKP